MFEVIWLVLSAVPVQDWRRTGLLERPSLVWNNAALPRCSYSDAGHKPLTTSCPSFSFWICHQSGKKREGRGGGRGLAAWQEYRSRHQSRWGLTCLCEVWCTPCTCSSVCVFLHNVMKVRCLQWKASVHLLTQYAHLIQYTAPVSEHPGSSCM